MLWPGLARHKVYSRTIWWPPSQHNVNQYTNHTLCRTRETIFTKTFTAIYKSNNLDCYFYRWWQLCCKHWTLKQAEFDSEWQGFFSFLSLVIADYGNTILVMVKLIALLHISILSASIKMTATWRLISHDSYIDLKVGPVFSGDPGVITVIPSWFISTPM